MTPTHPTFTAVERARAIAWKAATRSLHEADRSPAPYQRPGGRTYEFCLPLGSAERNLLPEVRSTVTALFDAEHIPWHKGVGDGPTNHLLSSQVQCVNALGQMIHDPARIIAAFGTVLDIAEVLQIEDGRWLTFEFIGPTDYFGEAPNGVRTRGSQCTSVDAAFAYRTSTGVEELALVEWKYTESYRERTPAPTKDEVRRQRYEAHLHLDGSPVRGDALPFARLLDEPFYQLMRQQLLAAALERDPGVPAEAVRVVHVHPAANLAYQDSLHHDEHRALGSTVAEVWAALLTRPDRYVELDNSVFLDPAITSTDYAARYG